MSGIVLVLFLLVLLFVAYMMFSKGILGGDPATWSPTHNIGGNPATWSPTKK